MNSLDLFEDRDCNGISISLKGDTPDLAPLGFDNKAFSMRITGDPWVVFTDKHYGGSFEVFKEGTYNSIPDLANQISSARIITGGLYNPKIIVFEDLFYSGKSATITDDTRSVKNYGLSFVSSHRVQSGCWILYDQENFQGKRLITLAGDVVPYYCNQGWMWNEKVMSLRPVKP